LGFTDQGNKRWLIGGLAKGKFYIGFCNITTRDEHGSWQKKEEYGNKGRVPLPWIGENRTMVDLLSHM